MKFLKRISGYDYVIAFYKVYDCIQSSTTIAQLESCERMINNLKGCSMAYLADLCLFKKIDILTTIYSEENV